MDLEKLYKTFSEYRLPNELNLCTYCCVEKSFEVELKSTPLKNITAAQFREYNGSAKYKYTEKDVCEIKFFLPRMIELVLQEKEIHPFAVELFFERLGLVENKLWFENELLILETFCIEYFNKIIYSNKIPFDAELVDVLIMLSYFPIDLSKLLNYWMKCRDLISINHFKDFFYNEILNSKKEKLMNSFSTNKLNKEVYKWLQDEHTIKTWVEAINTIEIESLSDNQLNEFIMLTQILINYAK